MRRWLKRIALGLLALVIVAVATVLIVVHTDWGRERIRRRIEAALRDAFPGGARVGRLEGSVLGVVVLRDVELDRADGAPLVTAGTIHVDLALTPLFGKTARIASLVVEDVHVVIAKSPPAAAEPAPSPSPSGGSAWTIELPSFELDRVAVEVVGATGTQHFDGIVIAGSARLPAGAPIAAAIAAHGTWRERTAPFTVAATAGFDRERNVASVSLISATLAGLGLSGAGLVVDLDHPAGVVVVDAPAAAVAALEPRLVLPGDAHVAMFARAAPIGTELELTAAARGSRLHAWLAGSPASRIAHGLVLVTGVDAAELGHGRLTGRGDAVAAIVAEPGAVRGSIVVRGRSPDGLEASALVALDGTLARSHALVVGGGPGGSLVGGYLEGAWSHGSLVVEPMLVAGAPVPALIATVTDPRAATGGRVDLGGAVRVAAYAQGAVAPNVGVSLAGTFDGRRVSAKALTIGSVRGRFTGLVTRVTALGSVHADAEAIAWAGSPVGRATLDARNRLDDTIAATISATPARAPLRLDATAIVTPGQTTEVAIEWLRVHTRGVDWVGRGGHATLAPELVTVRDVRLALGDSAITVAAHYHKDSGDLDGNVSLTAVPAAAIDPAYLGTAGAHLAIARRATRWTATATVTGTGLAVRPGTPELDGRGMPPDGSAAEWRRGSIDGRGMPPDGSAAEWRRGSIDGRLHVVLAGRRVTLDGSVTSRLGQGSIAADIQGPRDPFDLAGWLRIERPALTSATLEVDRLELGALLPKIGGVLEGALDVTRGQARGSFAVRGVTSPAGTFDAQVEVTPDQAAVAVSASANLAGIGEATAHARLAPPDRIADATAWSALGRDVVREAGAELRDVTIDPALLARFGLELPYHGKASASLTVGVGGTTANVVVDAREIAGGVLVLPIEAHLEAAADGTSSSVAADVSAKQAVLVAVRGELPVPLAGWLDAPLAQLATPITSCTLTVPASPARDVLALFGRRDVIAGTIDGKGEVAGSLSAPSADLMVAARDVRVAPRLGGRAVTTLDVLAVHGTLDRGVVAAEVSAHEANGGTAHVTAKRRIHEHDLESAAELAHFDLAPVATLLPGALAGTSGLVDATLALRTAVDLAAHVAGRLHITDGRIPLAPKIGTLRDATADLVIDDAGLNGTVDAKLGAGRIHAVAKASLARGDADATVTLRQVSPIGALEPRIDADVTAKLRRDRDAWRADVTVDHGAVVVRQGTRLLANALPSDLILDASLLPTVTAARAPAHPWLIAKVAIHSTSVQAELGGLEPEALRGSIAGNVTVSLGDTLGLDGAIDIENGDATIFGRRYDVDHGSVTFDGTTDGILDLRLLHDFPTLTLQADITQRISAPHLELTSQPGGYTTSQLFEFFLGGEPGGDPGLQTREAATGATASLLSSGLGRQFKRVLPIRIDSVSCEPATTTTGFGCSVGRWYSDRLYVSVKHVDALPTENPNSINFQYLLTHHLSLEGNGGDAGFYGGDFLWRKRW